MKFKIFRMKVICSYCNQHFKTEWSYRPGQTHGCCPSCFEDQKSIIRRTIRVYKGLLS